MNDNVEEKVWNINIVLDEIKKFPQTYNTILGEHNSKGTYQTIIRRKLNKLCKSGLVYKTTIPGTRFGKVVFYCWPKKYHIVVVGSRTGVDLMCFFNYENVGRYYVKIKTYWVLEKKKWKKYNKKRFIFEGNVLKWV